MPTETMSAAPPETDEAAGADAPVVREERLLPHAPRKVWRALTRPDALDRWLLPVSPSGDAPAVPLDRTGRRVTLRAAPGARVAYEVIHAEPERRLDLAWRVITPDGETAPARVTWTLAPEEGGAATRLVVEHIPPLATTAAFVAAAAPLGGAAARLAAYLEFVAFARRRPMRRRRLGFAGSPRLTGRSTGTPERKATGICR